MKILALETSAKAVSVAVTENGRVLSSAYQNVGLTHSVTLMPLLDGMLKNAGLTMEDIDCVAVANGPGSFTGLRIGVSAAKGLAWTRGIPCCGVSTLEAMAQNVRDHDGIVICAMDARRDQIGGPHRMRELRVDDPRSAFGERLRLDPHDLAESPRRDVNHRSKPDYRQQQLLHAS